ncbi:uncharacterized protein RAG0_09321 [Rhynchosporium agropyri]|uniref:Uncharacterized protein n=2 Tax=Rhynchosporium TaxID=38037 RepID=A0A1E1MVS6_RHYSE|nr:uncharacterized protein RAG0_09321 [Rhynchosporium agropyri]CZT53183.1 uncharacterized protein RSE6_14651 [Rhynchosporium secalis]
MASTPNTPGSSSASSPAPSHLPPAGYPFNPFSASNSAHNSNPASASTSSSSRPRGATPRNLKASRPRNGPGPPPFTASMQDAQARDKDPYESSDDDSDDGRWKGGGRLDAFGEEPYEVVQRRRMAAVILDSPELLMMHSQARCDSIPATRHYFTKLLCGFEDQNDTYPTDGQLHDPEKEKKKEKEKDKARMVAPGGQKPRR